MAKTTEASMRAHKRYMAKNVSNFPLYFNRVNERDVKLKEWLDKQPSKNAYIKQLVEEDMTKKAIKF